MGTGAALLVISFGVAASVLPNSDFDNEILIPKFLDDLFDQGEEYLLTPGESAVFTHHVADTELPLMWGLQILDFQHGDKTQTSISDIFGNEIDGTVSGDPIVFDVLESNQVDVYNFEIQNVGPRTVTIVTLLIDDPENFEEFTDPDSYVNSVILPLALAGIISLSGIIILLAGIGITVLDWKKEKDRPRYY